jgi:hypothetical protein
LAAIKEYDQDGGVARCTPSADRTTTVILSIDVPEPPAGIIGACGIVQFFTIVVYQAGAKKRHTIAS